MRRGRGSVVFAEKPKRGKGCGDDYHRRLDGGDEEDAEVGRDEVGVGQGGNFDGGCYGCCAGSLGGLWVSLPEKKTERAVVKCYLHDPEER